VLAQIELFTNHGKYENKVYVLPKHLFHTEPASELRGISQRAPDPFPWCMQQDFFLDAICAHGQPPGCRLAEAKTKCNHQVALREHQEEKARAKRATVRVSEGKYTDVPNHLA
jgi:hypothetical protein